MKLLRNITCYLSGVAEVCTGELRRVFSNSGVLLVFFVAGLGYPLLFNLIYEKENLTDVPVAVVDDSRSVESRRFIRKCDATPEVQVRYHCNSIEEARSLMDQHKINGIIYFPAEYGAKIAQLEQTRICLFCDMSSFLYYKSVFMGANFAMLDEMHQIEFVRYGMTGITGEQAAELVTPVAYDDVKLFVPGGGFTSFLIPALLILVIHQTLFFGIGMVGGSAREDGTEVSVIPDRYRKSRHDVVAVGRLMAYMLIYLVLVAIDLFLIPELFELPHIGRFSDLVVFFLPFLLATICFAITCSCWTKTRESGIVTMVFFSVILLFLSGFAWPQCSMPAVWRYFSYIFPSTHAIQGYVRINSMGATLHEVEFEYLMLWVLTAVYFVTACLSVRYTVRRHEKEYPETEAII